MTANIPDDTDDQPLVARRYETRDDAIAATIGSSLDDLPDSVADVVAETILVWHEGDPHPAGGTWAHTVGYRLRDEYADPDTGADAYWELVERLDRAR